MYESKYVSKWRNTSKKQYKKENLCCLPNNSKERGVRYGLQK